MPLKDWTKVADGWVLFRRTPTTGKVRTGYIKIISPKKHLGRQDTWLVDGKILNKHFQKHFKTKSQALKFAKAYMRKH